MKDISKISVYYHGREVGSLMQAPDSNASVFGYSEEWLEGGGFSLSPLELPLRKELFVSSADKFYGNFAIFDNSMPDGYGLYLLNRMLKAQGSSLSDLSTLQRMALVGDAGMGALCYHPSIHLKKEEAVSDFDLLQQKALDILSEKSDSDASLLYYNSGNSGGARPKAIFSDAEGNWLVKFRHTYDPEDIGQTEYLYTKTAEECGIEIPEVKLINDRYFASKRFDIKNGVRLHTATAAALMISDFRSQTADYLNILSLTGYLTQDPAQVEQMFRRMVFNVVADNKDDHAKNFSFIYNEDSGWALAPAYDLTYSPKGGIGGERATSVMYKGFPSREDLIAAGKSIRISEHRCRQIIDEVLQVCKSRLPQCVLI